MTIKEDIKQALVALRPRLRRFAYGLTGSLDDAEELVQSAYVRALARLDQWQHGTRLDSWMYRIIYSIQVNNFHAERNHNTHNNADELDELMGSDGARDMEARLTLDAVRRFIWQLPEDQRTVLLLITVEGLSYKEAAELLDVPIGTITSRLARARLAVNAFVNEPPAQHKPVLKIGSDLP